MKPRATQIFGLRGFFSLSLNKQATKAKKQKKVAGKLHFIFAKKERTRLTPHVSASPIFCPCIGKRIHTHDKIFVTSLYLSLGLLTVTK